MQLDAGSPPILFPHHLPLYQHCLHSAIFRLPFGAPCARVLRSGSRIAGPSGGRPSAPSQRRWRPSRAEPGASAAPHIKKSTPPCPPGAEFVFALLLRGQTFIKASFKCKCDLISSSVRGLLLFLVILPPSCLRSHLQRLPSPACPARLCPPTATCWPASTVQVHKYTHIHTVY